MRFFTLTGARLSGSSHQRAWRIKEALQAGIGEIVFGEPMAYSPELEAAYQQLILQSGVVLRRYSGD